MTLERSIDEMPPAGRLEMWKDVVAQQAAARRRVGDGVGCARPAAALREEAEQAAIERDELSRSARAVVCDAHLRGGGQVWR